MHQDNTDDMPRPEDVQRFRRATLKARLALLGVVFDPAADEETLARMVRVAEEQAARKAARQGRRT